MCGRTRAAAAAVIGTNSSRASSASIVRSPAMRSAGSVAPSNTNTSWSSHGPCGGAHSIASTRPSGTVSPAPHLARGPPRPEAARWLRPSRPVDPTRLCRWDLPAAPGQPRRGSARRRRSACVLAGRCPRPGGQTGPNRLWSHWPHRCRARSGWERGELSKESGHLRGIPVRVEGCAQPGQLAMHARRSERRRHRADGPPVRGGLLGPSGVHQHPGQRPAPARAAPARAPASRAAEQPVAPHRQRRAPGPALPLRCAGAAG